jgi:UV DNA damage repair endonuclease
MAARKTPGGRTVGSKNKFPQTAKENVIAVFTRLGGTAAMAEWARENQTEFYRLYGKLLPLQVSGENGALEVVLKIAPHD